MFSMVISSSPRREPTLYLYHIRHHQALIPCKISLFGV
jgi:hypothetical protein